MTFLPFVVTFLIVISLGSSVLFNSIESTLFEKRLMLAQKSAHLSLVSNQTLAKYNRLRKRKYKPRRSQNTVEKKQRTSSPISSKALEDPREKRSSFNASKFNLWPIVHEPNSLAAKILYEKAILLINELYQKAQFYQEADDRGIAEKVIASMLGKKVNSLTELFPKEVHLDEIYYKMLKGTNTGYPSLEEFFKIEPSPNAAPIKFTYASIPVLKAILGEEITEKILKAERLKRAQNPRSKTLTKRQFEEIICQLPASDLSLDEMFLVFSFCRREKGAPEIYVEEQLKIMTTKKPTSF